jgi:hypothetical protein
LENGRRQRIRAIFREEQARVLDFHHAPSARNGILQPTRPRLIEEHILKSPYDQGGHPKRLERRMNGDGLRVIKAEPVSLERL